MKQMLRAFHPTNRCSSIYTWCTRTVRRKHAGEKCSWKLFLLHAVCESVQAATVTNLELNIAALRQLDIKGPDIAVIPLHLGSIADIPVPKTRVASNNLVAFTK